MDRVLIVRGATTADSLRHLGLPMARRFADADMVIGIDLAGNATVMKARELIDASFVDADSQLGDLAQIFSMIKDAYIEKSPPQDAHLAHAIVGLWLFYWIGRGGRDDLEPLVMDMIARGDIERVRASALSYIEADFGRDLSPADKMQIDGADQSTT